MENGARSKRLEKKYYYWKNYSWSDIPAEHFLELAKGLDKHLCTHKLLNEHSVINEFWRNIENAKKLYGLHNLY